MLNSTTLDNFKNQVSVNSTLINSKGAFIPVIEEHFADTETPLSIYLKIKSLTTAGNTFIFESAESDARNGRYSIIGLNPFCLFKIEQQAFSFSKIHKDFNWLTQSLKASKPLDALNEVLQRLAVVHPEGLPRLIAGAVGFLGYDTIRLVENVPENVVKDQDIPDGILGFYNKLIIFDNYRKTIMFIHAPFVADPEEATALFKNAKKETANLTAQIFALKTSPFIPAKREVSWAPNIEKDIFEAHVKKAKEYIKAGDIFQVVLSQRFETKYEDDPFNLFRVLRIINPSPYLYFIDFEDLQIIGSSPELLVRVDEQNVYTRPIAGTRPRGKNNIEDRALEADLMQDEKECAEHVMLVDLGRNDLGKVCKSGSVEVIQMMKVERYSHVMHIISDVSGVLDKAHKPTDILYATFPAGTLSGAPKIRAMEIIDELEPTARSVYGGAIGYFDFGGNMDWCIAIRTLILNKNRLTLQAGAGIVADSVPENEYIETINKAQALKQAVEWSANAQNHKEDK